MVVARKAWHVFKRQWHANIDYIALCMQLHNAWRELTRQWRQHSVSAILMGLGALFIGVKLNPWQAPAVPIWLREYGSVFCAALIALALWNCHSRCQRGALALHDWLAVQPIPDAVRQDFLRLKIALGSALELSLFALLALWFAGSQAAGLVALLGAILCAARLAGLARFDKVAFQREVAHSAHSDIKPVLQSPAMRAIFLGAIPSAARFRYGWFLPLLTMPMGAKLALIALVLVSFLLLMHFAALNSALASGIAQLAQLTRAQPLTPNQCYRIALRFCVYPLTLVALLLLAALITYFFAASLAHFGLLLAAAGALGLWVLGNQLHLHFAFRFEPANASIRWRSEIALVLLLVIGITLPPALPLIFAASWRWLYLRGRHY
jgi:hypothetical protein